MRRRKMYHTTKRSNPQGYIDEIFYIFRAVGGKVLVSAEHYTLGYYHP